MAGYTIKIDDLPTVLLRTGNSFEYRGSSGFEPARAVVYMTRKQVDDTWTISDGHLSGTAADLTLTPTPGKEGPTKYWTEVTLKNLYPWTAEHAMPGSATSDNAVYQVTLVDCRHFGLRTSINKDYNVRLQGGTAGSSTYTAGSLNGAVVWTIQQIIDDLWGMLDSSIFPATITHYTGGYPTVTPIGLRFNGVSVFEALNYLFTALGLTLSYDPFEHTFAVVALGADQPELASLPTPTFDAGLVIGQKAHLYDEFNALTQRTALGAGAEKDTEASSGYADTHAARIYGDYTASTEVNATGAFSHWALSNQWVNYAGADDATFDTNLDNELEAYEDRVQAMQGITPLDRTYHGFYKIVPTTQVREVHYRYSRNGGSETRIRAYPGRSYLPDPADAARAKLDRSTDYLSRQYPQFPRTDQVVRTDNAYFLQNDDEGGPTLVEGHVLRYSNGTWSTSTPCKLYDVSALDAYNSVNCIGRSVNYDPTSGELIYAVAAGNNAQMAVLDEDLEHDLSATATIWINPGASPSATPVKVEVRDWLLSPDTFIPAGTRVIITRVNGSWLVTAAGCTAEEA